MSDIVERLRNCYAHWGTFPECAEAADEIARLRAEIEALRADAERYRWWTRNYGSKEWTDHSIQIFTIVPNITRRPLSDKAVFDAAIDAARSSK